MYFSARLKGMKLRLLLLLALTPLLSFVHALDDDFDFDVSDDFEVEFPSQEAATHHHGNKKTDHVTLANKIFKFVVPKSSLDVGSVKHYEARIDEDGLLPPWLLFDKSDGIFWGVPLESDVGTFRVKVKAFGADSNAVVVYDFNLIVKANEDPAERCPLNEDTTLLTLIVDKASKAIKPKQRVIAINNIAKFFDIPYYNFTLKSQTHVDDINDSSVILAGPGNLKSRTSKSTALIEVPVGCEGRLWLKSAPIVHQLKQQARDGTISEVLRLPLVGWRVKTETRSLLRKKRQDDSYTGSGDYEYYEYEDYDDPNGGDTEESTSTTTAATSITFASSTNAIQPVITQRTSTTEKMTSPDPVSPTHPHRHHHGEAKPFEESEEPITLPEYSPTEPTTNFVTQEHTNAASSSVHTPVTERTLFRYTTPSVINIPITTPKLILTTVLQETNTLIDIDEVKPEVSTQMTGLYKPSIRLGPDEEDYDEYDDDDESETQVPFTDSDVSFTPNKPDPVIAEIAEDAETTVIDIVTTPRSSAESVEVITMPARRMAEAVPTAANVTEESTTPRVVTLHIETTTPYSIPEESTTVLTSASTETSSENFTIEEETSSTKRATTRNTPSVYATMTTSSTSTTTPRVTTAYDRATEKVEFEVKNFAPTVQIRLNRIAVTAGKNFSQAVPENMFSDLEDGTNLRLDFLDKDGNPVKPDSWCQFNPRTREIYGLPLRDDISGWNFFLRATDKEGATVSEKVEIIVQQNKYWRVVNHQFTLFAHVQKQHAFSYPVDWALYFLSTVTRTLGGHNFGANITVKSIDYNVDPVIFSWTNDTLNTNYCQIDDILALYKILSGVEGNPSSKLNDNLAPSATAMKVTLDLMGVCEIVDPHPPQPTSSTPSHLPPVRRPSNLPPILRNPVDHINATVGELLVYRVPEDTFYDPEDVDPRNLKLHLYTLSKKEIPGDHWLQFDSKNKEFYGVPSPRDTKRLQYQLVCEDSGGLTSSDTLVVEIHPAPKLKYNIEFSMTLETDYESFARSASAKRKFVEKLRRLFDDETTDNIHLSVPAKGSRDSTIVTWNNKSLAKEKCPWEEINTLENLLVNKDRAISNRVHNIMGDDFVVSAFRLQHLGACRKQVIPERPRPHDTVVPSLGVDENGATRETSNEYLLTFIVPAIIISLMLLVAGIAACVMYRRRRSGKMNLEEDGRQSYGNKGIPVIFQEELDEKPESGTKTPIILKDERPPLAPPEYSKSGGSLKLTDDSEPYQPPPPFTRNQDNGRQPRPKPTPTYRKPPPYVPP